MKEKITVQVCDNPDCQKTVLPDCWSFKGYTLRGNFDDGSRGGPVPTFFACSEECILPAMRARIEEDWR